VKVINKEEKKLGCRTKLLDPKNKLRQTYFIPAIHLRRVGLNKPPTMGETMAKKKAKKAKKKTTKKAKKTTRKKAKRR